MCQPTCSPDLVQDTRASDKSNRYWTAAELSRAGSHASETRPPDDFVQNLWQRVAVDAVTVHIESSKHCLISIPLCQDLVGSVMSNLLQGGESYDLPDCSNAVWLARLLSQRTFEMFEEKGYAQQWRQEGWNIHETSKNHKEESYNLGDRVVFVKQCTSVRKAYCVVVERAEAGSHSEGGASSDAPPVFESHELMHLNVCMGLEKQFRSQITLLARMSSHELSVCLLKCLCGTLGVHYRPELCTCLIPAEAKKNGTPEFIRTQWENMIALCSIPQSNKRVYELSNTTIPTSWEDVVECLQTCLGNELDEAIDIVSRHSSLSQPLMSISEEDGLENDHSGPEPPLDYVYEKAWFAKTPPALLYPENNIWRGRLFLGSISAALSKPWLRWAGVTHCICALGKYDKNGLVAKEYEVSQQSHFPGVLYYMWPINFSEARLQFQAVFNAMYKVLQSPGGCLLVHCRNGKDRSAFLIYAYLRFMHNYGHASALHILSVRRSVQGHPLFEFDNQSFDLIKWVENILNSRDEVDHEWSIEWNS